MPAEVNDGPPLVPGRIHGIRVWRCDRGRERGIHGINGVHWKPHGEPTRARCMFPGSDHLPNVVPAAECMCGLYAFHPRDANVEAVWPSALAGVPSGPQGAAVVGVVEAWGRVEVHPDGFRAELARPIAFFRPDSASERYRRRVRWVAEHHAAPVIEVKGPGDILRWCEANAPGLDAASVRELVPEEEDEPVALPAVPVGRAAATRRRPLLERVGELCAMCVLGAIALAWYGAITLAGVMIFGALFLGWDLSEDPPPPRAAPALELVEDRLVRYGDGSGMYVAIVRNTSATRAAAGVFPFGPLSGSVRRLGERKAEGRPTIAPGATGVVFDRFDVAPPEEARPRARFAARMLPARGVALAAGRVRVDRRLCLITGVLRADRPLRAGRIALVARDGEGRIAGGGTVAVGPIARGRSTKALWRLAPGDCRRPPPRFEAFAAPRPRDLVRAERRR